MAPSDLESAAMQLQGCLLEDMVCQNLNKTSAIISIGIGLQRGVGAPTLATLFKKRNYVLQQEKQGKINIVK